MPTPTPHPSRPQGALLIAGLLYTATGIGGYAAFGVDSSPDVLDNFLPGPMQPLPDAVVLALRAAFAGCMISTFPTLSYGLRTSLHALAFPGRDESALLRWTEVCGHEHIRRSTPHVPLASPLRLLD